MKPETVPVRLSHLLHHSSVGSIVRGERLLMVVEDTRSWFKGGAEPQPIQYVDQVRSMLGISEVLCPPPEATEEDSGEIDGRWIPAMLFPQWMQCPACGLLHSRPWRRSQSGPPWKCRNCARILEQVPWVLAHAEGYLADVPWHAIAHSGRTSSSPACPPDWEEPYLRLVQRDSHRAVTCDRCRASQDLPDRFPFPARSRPQPWVREKGEQVSDSPEDPAWILGINDVRVHSSRNSSALVIPPESRIRRGTVVDRLYSNSTWQRQVRRARNPLQKKAELKRIAVACHCPPQEVEAALQEIENGYPLYGQTVTGEDLRQGEYRALSQPVPDQSEEEDFVTFHNTRDWKNQERNLRGLPRQAVAAVDRLIEVRRLKEVLVLRGFRRLNSENYIRPDLTGEATWLPALELHGEGVFFTLDESTLKAWERQPALGERSRPLAERAALIHPPVCEEQVTPRLLFLHTLAHLLIRQLESAAGYPAAALKERIYCQEAPSPMAGILIYVAVPDEVGSMGGLSELASPSRFLRLLVAALETAAWCSLDPVCREQEGCGPHLLNRAACHACVLVPETTCQFGNVLLDRGFVQMSESLPFRPLWHFAGET